MIRCLPYALTILSLLMLPSVLHAQKEGYAWRFGRGAGVDFTTGSPTPVPGAAIIQDEGCASIADRSTGSLLFYTDGVSVWDRNDAVMPGGGGLLGDTSSTQSAVIVPMPGNDTAYYIFTSDSGPYKPRGAGVNYSIVDMRLNGGFGDVAVKNRPLFAPATEKLAAVKHCNKVDYWVIAHEWGTNRFRSYLVTSRGVSAAPVISAVGVTHAGSGANAIGNLKASPNGRWLGSALLGGSRLEIYTFDPATGVVSNPIAFTPMTGGYGLSFSPDNSKLYAVSGNYLTANNSNLPSPPPPSDTIFQFDLASNNPAVIQASRTRIFATNGEFIGSMQIGPDGKIYVGRSGATLGIINNPNVAGTGCNYIHNGLGIAGSGTCTDGLPNLIDGWFNESPPEEPCLPPEANFGPMDTTICLGICLQFHDSSTGAPTIWEWTFDGATPNISTDRHPMNICYRRAGTFVTRLVVGREVAGRMLRDTAYGRVIVVAPPQADAGRDTTICLGDSVRLTASGGGTYAWSPDIGLSCVDCADPIASPTMTTTYRVVVTNEYGCSAIDSVTVNVATAPGVDAGLARSICEGDSVQLSATGGTTYRWTPATGLSCTDCATPIARPTTTTTYTVIARNESGCSGGDTVTVTVFPQSDARVTADTTICLGDSVQLSATGGTIFRWAPAEGLSCADCADPVARPSATTRYRVVVSNRNGCPDTAFVNVAVAARPDAEVGPDLTICLGDSVRLAATGGGEYQWNSSEDLSCLDCPDPIATPQATTTYTVRVTTGSGCWDTASVTVTVYPVPVAIATVDGEVCRGDTAQLSVSGGDAYSWSPAEGLSCADCSDPLAFPDRTTTYRVVAVGAGGCADTALVEVVVHPRPPASAGEDVEFCLGGSAQLQASGGGTYSWSPAEGLSCVDCADPIASPAKTTEYTVTITSDRGCVAEDRVTVRVRSPRTIRAHISKTLATSPGWVYSFPITLDSSLNGERVSELEVTLEYNSKVLQLVNGTPQRVGSMLTGTLLEGWAMTIQQTAPGLFKGRVTAPDGVYLSDTGMLLNIQCRMFLGNAPGCDLPFTVTLGKDVCASMIVDPGYIRLDSICGLSQRLIEIGVTDYALDQNRPNPFNPATEIRFSLGLEGHTTLVIYDAVGREVARPVDGYLESGAYVVIWDASAYPSGLYYYRLTSGDWSRTNRMLLVK